MSDNETKKKILIIEDEEGLVLSIGTLLRGNGYDVTFAYDAAIGTMKAHSEKPDLILLDMGLPAGGGLSVLENLKGTVSTSGIPVLVLTANALAEMEEKARALGAADYLKKPFDPPHLLETIKKILG